MLPKGRQNGIPRGRLCIPKQMNFRKGFKRWVGGSFLYQFLLQIFLFIEAIFDHESMPKPANTKAPKIHLYWDAHCALHSLP